MKCVKCGQTYPNNGRFCPYCGTPAPHRSRPGFKCIGHFLVIVLSFSTTALGSLYIHTSSKLDSALFNLETNKSEFEKNKKSLEHQISELREKLHHTETLLSDSEWERFLLETQIGFVTAEGTKYHVYDCSYIQNADYFAAHNIEYCEMLGYLPCSQCH